MQITQVNIEQLAEMLTEGERLATLEGTQRVEVLRWGVLTQRFLHRSGC